MKRFELINIAARAVANFNDLRRHLHGRDGDYVFLGRPQGGTAAVGRTDNAAISGGSNSTIMCQDIVMTLARPLRAVVNNTTGPGSNNR